jgi:CoA:oxalate CoA-transferase
VPRINVFEGIRIIDFSRAYSGPFGSQLLADMGAEIIKIEVPGVGDFARAMSPYIVPGQSYTIQALNRNKKSVTLNVNTELGRQAFHDLVKISDVVYGNLRYNALARMGADYKTLRKINPRIILCNITGYGTSGPYAEYASYDDNLLAVSGIASLNSRDPEGRPNRIPIALADIAGGLFSVIGIQSALYQREHTGEGCEVKCAILDCCLSLLNIISQSYFISGKVPKPVTSRHPIGGISGAFRTKNGMIVLAPCWPAIARVTNREDLFTDPRFDTVEKRFANNGEICDILELELMKKDTEYWLEVMRQEDIAVSPLNNLDRVFEDPQVKHNKMQIEITHPVYGKTTAIECPLKIEGAKESPHFAPPTLGQDTEQVLTEVLGYSEEKIKKIKQEEEAAADKVRKRIKAPF